MTGSNDTLRISLKVVESEGPSALSLLLSEFILDRQAGNLTEGSLSFYRQKLTPFLDYLASQGITGPDQVKPTHLRRFLLTLQETGHTPGGQHAYYRAIQAFFNWLEQEDELELNPIRRVKAPRVPEELLEPASLEHVRAMLETCDKKTARGCRDRAIIMALLDTGARAGEMLALNIGDVDLSNGSVVIRCGKGRKPRVTFLGARSLRVLMQYLRLRGRTESDAPLWVTLDGNRLAYSSLRDIVRRRAKEASVPALTLHAFRRAFAIYSLRNGTDVYSLQRLMGHTSLQVLRRYLKQTEADLREAHRKAGPVDSLL